MTSSSLIACLTCSGYASVIALCVPAISPKVNPPVPRQRHVLSSIRLVHKPALGTWSFLTILARGAARRCGIHSDCTVTSRHCLSARLYSSTRHLLLLLCYRTFTLYRYSGARRLLWIVTFISGFQTLLSSFVFCLLHAQGCRA